MWAFRNIGLFGIRRHPCQYISMWPHLYLHVSTTWIFQCPLPPPRKWSSCVSTPPPPAVGCGMSLCHTLPPGNWWPHLENPFEVPLRHALDQSLYWWPKIDTKGLNHQWWKSALPENKNFDFPQGYNWGAKQQDRVSIRKTKFKHYSRRRRVWLRWPR